MYTLISCHAEYSTLSYISPPRPEDLLATSLNLYEGFRGSLRILAVSRRVRYAILHSPPRTEDILTTTLSLDEGFRGSLRT